MFGLFGGDKAKVRKLRIQYEDIRQRVLYKMDGYSQYCFATGYLQFFDEVDTKTKSFSASSNSERTAFSNYIKSLAQQAWQEGTRGSGGDMHREAMRAGADALALHSIAVDAEFFQIAEARTLTTDIVAFRKRIEKYLDDRKGLNDMIPTE